MTQRSRAFAGAPALALALALALAVTVATPPASAQRWTIHAGTGVAYNAPSSLVIEQARAPDLSLTARFDTRAFETPLYYVVRVERGSWSGGAIALELVHHKLFLENPPAEVQELAISHGFNIVTVQRVWTPIEGRSVRAGAGVVVAHPETTVRGRAQPKGGWLDRGYYVAGPVAQLGAGLSRRLIGRARVGVETKLVGARAWVPIADGSARLWHASAHLDALVSVGL
jgi:hypothetical protein